MILQMAYKCTSVGCKETSEAGGVDGDMLVITRNLQTVRAVDVNSGLEKLVHGFIFALSTDSFLCVCVLFTRSWKWH